MLYSSNFELNAEMLEAGLEFGVVELGPGDVLFMPKNLKHQVTSLPGRNLAFTLDLNFPPPDELNPLWENHFFDLGSENSAEYYKRWRAGKVPAALLEALEKEEEEEEGEVWTLASVPTLDDAEAIWDVILEAGLGWIY